MLAWELAATPARQPSPAQHPELLQLQMHVPALGCGFFLPEAKSIAKPHFCSTRDLVNGDEIKTSTIAKFFILPHSSPRLKTAIVKCTRTWGNLLLLPSFEI